MPVRELTFQALKPNPPHKWKVVVFGQNPYPRAESATGIAMFDNTFHNWDDSQFGKVITIRCVIKAAAMWKHGIPKKTPIADIRALLKRHDTVQPPERTSPYMRLRRPGDNAPGRRSQKLRRHGRSPASTGTVDRHPRPG